MTEAEKLTQAINLLEAQRPVLGTEVVEVALAPLRQRLAEMQTPAAGEAQRKLLTILFADIAGFTALAEKMDAEDVAALVNQLWHKLDHLLISHGAHIDKHLGDGVMALWGTTTIREDDPEQAIRAALELQETIQHWAPPVELEVPLSFRVGINTGPVLLGTVGLQGEITALGDAVNLAARLAQAAPPGGIVIAHSTYRTVRGLFEVQPQSPFKVKGKTDPVQSYLVKYAKPRTFHLQTRGVEGVETRMVGRDKELRCLQDTLLAVGEQRRWQVITVVGEAGIGKSRLLYEFNSWTELRPQSWRLFKGRADETMTRTPYALWRDIFAFRFEIQDSDTNEAACAKMTQGVLALLPAAPQAEALAHRVGHLIGLDFSHSPHVRPYLAAPQQLQTQGRQSLVQLFSALAQQQPVALQLEDIHWADTESLDTLEYLLQTLPAVTPLFGLWLARPTLLEQRPSWNRQPNHACLTLKPLSAYDSAQLAHEILQKVPQWRDTLQATIVQNAAGNPFYLEELVKMLIDERVIVPLEEVWQVQPDRLAEMHLPATLQGILQARLEGLTPAERAALQRAAVIGQVFWAEAVLALDPQTANAEANLVSPLTFITLQQKELIYRRATSAFAGCAEYNFKHALLRDVAYDMVLKRDRPPYHALAAQWLTRHGGERGQEFAPLIADHHERAGENLLAAQYLLNAATRAQAVSAFAESIATLEHLIQLLSKEPALEAENLQLTARIRLGEIYGRGQDAHAEAKSHLEPALALARERNDQRNLAAALGQLGWVVLQQGDYARAQDYFEEALPLARALQDTAQEIYILRQLGNVALAFDSYESARAHYEASLAVAQAANARDGIAHAQASLGNAYEMLGDNPRALQQFQAGLIIFHELGERRYMATALINICRAHLNLHEYPAARQAAEEALTLGREVGSVGSIAAALSLLGKIAYVQKDWAQAEVNFAESLTLHQAIGQIPELLDLLVDYARLLLQLENQQTLALQLLGLVAAHPVTGEALKATVQQTLANLPTPMPPAEVQAALARGAALKFEDVQRLVLLRGLPTI